MKDPRPVGGQPERLASDGATRAVVAAGGNPCAASRALLNDATEQRAQAGRLVDPMFGALRHRPE